MLGAEHGIRQPAGLKALVISNSPASMELWSSEAKILRAELPPEVESALDRHEAAGTTSDPEYLAAQQVYYDLHVCRVVPNPPEVVRTFAMLAEDPTVYNVMNGPQRVLLHRDAEELERGRPGAPDHGTDLARLGPL